jgi:threonine/homoserine/homoserine lactone efflux protein
MMLDRFGAFLGVSVVVIITPGPDTALTTRNTLFGGRTGGVLTAVGVSTGQATWALASSVGLIAVLNAWQPALIIIRIAGGAYLTFLGARTLFGTVRAVPRPTPDNGGDALTHSAALRQGLISNLTNPKMAVFFGSFLPQFTLRTSFLELFLLGLLFSLMTLVWLVVYSLALARADSVLRRPRVRSLIESLTGCVLIVLGLRLVTER